MSEIVPFDFDDVEIRVILIGDQPWFVALDVCRALAYANPAKAVRDHVIEADRLQRSVRSGDQMRQTWLINESGLYALIFGSEMPDAKRFQRWVTSEVLPQIRRTGAYSVAKSPYDLMRAQIDQLEAVEHEAARANARIDAIEGKHDWYAALGYARLHKLCTEEGYLNRLGRRAAKIGRGRGLVAGRSPHAHYGGVNVWPESVWDEAYDEIGDPA